MSKTRCDLRVMVRFDDGTICGYAVNGITKAPRLRDELGVAGLVLTDSEMRGADCPSAEEWHPSVVEMFDNVHSPLTTLVRGARAEE